MNFRLAAVLVAALAQACAPGPAPVTAAPSSPAATPSAPAPSAPAPSASPLSAPTASDPSSLAPRGKPTAPVEVEAALQPGAARLTLSFGADAADVSVRLSGLDGLRVTSAPLPVERASYRRGERASLEATFVPGEGESFLVVAVQGTFAGARRAAVRSVAVGTRSPAQDEKARAGVVTDEKGERLHVLPAERR